MRKPAFSICENKAADQLRGNREADQRLCFRYIDSTIPLLSKSEISSLLSSHLLWLYSPVCVGPGRKPRRPVFSQRGSIYLLGKELFTRLTVGSPCELSICNLSYFLFLFQGQDISSDCVSFWSLLIFYFLLQIHQINIFPWHYQT